MILLSVSSIHNRVTRVKQGEHRLQNITVLCCGGFEKRGHWDLERDQEKESNVSSDTQTPPSSHDPQRGSPLYIKPNPCP